MNNLIRRIEINLAAIVILLVFSTTLAQLAPDAVGAWAPGVNMAVRRSDQTATLLTDGKVLIVGSQFAAKIAEVFDPTNGTFTRIADTLQAHGAGSTATRLSDGRVLIVARTRLMLRNSTSLRCGPLSQLEPSILHGLSTLLRS